MASPCLQRFIFSPQLIKPLSSIRVRAAAAGLHHTLVLLASGHVASFGRASYGALGRLNDDFDGNVPREAPELVDGLAGVQVASVSAGKPFPTWPPSLG